MQQGSEDLAALLAADLDTYFKQLVVTYQHRLYAFVLRQIGHAHDADDITQEALIRAYFALKSYPAERVRALKLPSWLFKIVINVMYSHTHKTRPQIVSLDLSEESPLLDIEDQAPGPEQEAWWREYRQELENMIAELPERYRVAVNLRYFEDLSYQEIAELLNQPLGTVKANIHRGVELLRTKHHDIHLNQVG
jgi:RNA polymerase sigma-70 factor (ECF subfamily)